MSPWKRRCAGYTRRPVAHSTALMSWRSRGAVVICVGAALASGCGPKAKPPLDGAAARRAAAGSTQPSLSPFRHVTQARSLPDAPGDDALRAQMIRNVRDRLMSHRDIERDAARMIGEIGPIVEAAAAQPEAQAGLEQYARDAGISEAEARRRWIRFQTADLMLESGGDPDALSSSAAAGVAQWLAGTARGVGLAVDLPMSNALTARINAQLCRIAWIRYLSRPDADRNAPGAPSTLGNTTQIPQIAAEIERLRVARRGVDARYDPQAAIFAQTRYLMRLYPRFPSLDWLFQAYHGGEGGAARLLRLYTGTSWPGTAAAAIRTGASGGPLTFDALFFTTSPNSHPAAFSYLFGRSDDHRHYWFKLLAAQETLDDYRRSADEFHHRWEQSLPGRRIEAYWYPDAASDTTPDVAALAQRKDLAPVAERPGLKVRPAQDDPGNAALYARLKPHAKGALLYVVDEFRRNGGRGPLETADLTLTEAYVDRARVLHPPKPPKPPIFPPDPDLDATIGGGPPRRFDYHTVGLVFDLARPGDAVDRKILEYTLDRLEARGLLAAIPAKDRDDRRYHIVAHPAYSEVFTRMAAQSP